MKPNFLPRQWFVLAFLNLVLCGIIAAQPDLAMSKTVNIPSPILGQNITFTLTVENIGVSDATGVVVNDLLPDGYVYVSDDSGGNYDDGTGIWTVGNLVATTSEILNIVVTVSNSGNYLNTATASCNEFATDPPGNNSASQNITAPMLTSQMAFRITKGNSVSFTFSTMDNFQSGIQLDDWTVFQVAFYDDFNLAREWGMTIEAESNGATGMFTGTVIPLTEIEIQFVTTTGLPVIPGFHDLSGTFGAPINIITGGTNHWSNHNALETVTISYRINNASTYPKDIYMLNLKYQMF